MDINKNMNDAVSYIHNHIVSQWDDIKGNTDIMNVLDIDNNNMCRYYKSNNPDLDIKHIQVRTLTLLFSMFLIISQPINDNIIDVD